MLSNRFLNIYQTYGRKFSGELTSAVRYAVVKEINQSRSISTLKKYELIGYFISSQINVRTVGDDLLAAEK